MEVKIEKIQKNFNFMIFFILIMVVFFCCFITTEDLMLLILTVIVGFLSLCYFLKYINEKIIIFDTEIKYFNMFGKQNEFSFDELSIRKVKKHYSKNTSSKAMYFRHYKIKEEYIFFSEENKIFKLVEDELKGKAKKVIDLAIKQNRLKTKKENIDGEDVIELKTNLNSLFFNLLIFLLLTLLIIPIVIGLQASFNIVVFIFCIVWIILDIYYCICLMKDIIQALQKVYYVENQGFYKSIFGFREYYDFKDIDDWKTTKYLCIEPVEYKLNLYKDNKKILTLTNSKIGFYNFFDEVKKIKR